MNEAQMIQMVKSRKKPRAGDLFVLQPIQGVFYYGKVIKTDLQSHDAFIRGMFLIFIYDYCSTQKEIVRGLESNNLLIAPQIVNKQPWLKGYFETIGNVEVTVQENNMDLGFWDMLRERYVDINGNPLDVPPKIRSVYGLGSYGIVSKEVYKALKRSYNFQLGR